MLQFINSSTSTLFLLIALFVSAFVFEKLDLSFCFTTLYFCSCGFVYQFLFSCCSYWYTYRL